jgi:Pyridoxamine 5'-phosphate oxidase
VNWKEFESAAPAMAKIGRKRLGRLALVGTVRRDGTPRISPVEPFIADGQLLLGMMRGSRKALDLLRDPRCVVQNAVSDPEGSQGEFKLRGRAALTREDGTRQAYLKAYARKWKRPPPEPFPSHLFVVDVSEAALIDWMTEEGVMVLKTWTPEAGVSEKRRKYP